MTTTEFFTLPKLRYNATKKERWLWYLNCGVIIWGWLLIIGGIFTPMAYAVFTRIT